MYFLDYIQSKIRLNFCITDDNEVKFLQCSQNNRVDPTGIDIGDYYWNRLVEVHLAGGNQNDHHFSKHTGSSEGFTLRYVGNEEVYVRGGKIFYIEQANEHISVRTYFRFYDGVEAFAVYNDVKNISDDEIALEYVSSFCFLGINPNEDWQDSTNVYIPHSYWLGECQWQKNSVKDLGLYNVGKFSGKRISVSNTGSWSAKEFLPMGILENTHDKEFVLWQIESSGSWNWEISTMAKKLYLMANGPTFSENGWMKKLAPGESFSTVRASVTFGATFEETIANITDYRRACRRVNDDNKKLPVIFNDYMNCLNADPSTQKEIPLINKAAELGCEYYCVDAGWYADGYWWDNVGEWQPSVQRFGGDFKGLIDYIRQKGMHPGLWLEPEVMGIKCPLAAKLPDDFFFMRNGKRVIDHSRYQLDFSNPEVVAFVDKTVTGLIEDYGVKYIKLDYNINAGVGTECRSDSLGDGLLSHCRAFLAWIDSLFERYPQLVIENCASGGGRLDQAMLKRMSIASTSDQTDYKKYSVIAANCVTALTPEQAAVWSYPLEEGDEEETAYNMVNCLLMRIHQSGNIAKLSPQRLKLVEDGIKLYKRRLRRYIPSAYGVWPLGVAKSDDPFMCFGLKCREKLFLAVWNLHNTQTIEIPLEAYRPKQCQLLYPSRLDTDFSFDAETKMLTVRPHQEYFARLFEFKI